jgi:Sperm-tail PG-rich repeat
MKSHPGPGAYDPHFERTRLSEAGYRMSKAAREDIIFNKSIRGKPSPLDYRPNDALTRSAMAAYKFGSQSRMASTSKFNSPGPDKYNITSKAIEGPKYGMGVKTSDLLAKRRESLPGPGAYD